MQSTSKGSRHSTQEAGAHRTHPSGASQGSAKPDGRVNRSIATRKKIVDALTALVFEGHITPTAEQVAQRADVGLRTVFRHFDDMDALYREISIDVDVQIQPLLQARLNAPTWQERVLLSIDHRSDIYDRTAALHLAAQVHRHESPYLTQNLMDAARLQRDLLQRLLPPAVAQDARLLEALDLMLSFEAWIRLRREQGLPADQAREVMRLGVKALLATVPQAT
ncbi:TetR/AcrR family transcriptional regulator [Roseateles sp.]|jgi:AcrR family transcriptional regulator|uniref:TetR/AcrR family transcriptional regulator n=1 Tax=Roseateles sp. TaxID=1971397 RepID=UPI003BACB52D